MKKINYILGTLLLPAFMVAQSSSIKKATKSYNNYDYSTVIEKVGDKKDISTDASRKLADSYKNSGNYLKAEEVYAKVVAAPDKNAEDVLNYAQILKMNGKYSESSQQMDAYNTIKAGDSRYNLFSANKNYVSEINTDKGQFTIKNLAINSAQQDFGAIYCGGEVVYTSSKRNLGPVFRIWNGNKLPYLDLYSAKADASNELTNATKISKINQKYHEGPSSYSKDGNITVYTTDNYKATSKDGVRKLQLFESKRKQDGTWGERVPFPFNNNDYSCGHPALTSDGNTLYFSSDMPGGKGGVDIYKTTRGADGKWTTPVNLGDKINTEGNEMFPFFHESGLFFFSSDGRPGLGGLDVFATEIKEGEISKVINVGTPLNTSKDDFSMVLDVNKKMGYFASNREGGKGDDDIYSYELLKPFVFGKTIKGTAKDKEGAILANTEVKLFDNAGNVIKTVTTNGDGTYSFNVDADKQFKLNGTKEKYFEGNNTANTTVKEDIIISDLVLEKDPGFSLLALITDNKSKMPLDGVNMKITDETGKLIEYVTTVNGDYKSPIMGKKLGDGIKYKIELNKTGYVSKTVDFVKTLDKPGEQKVHEALDLSLGKIEIGGDLAKMVDIKPIYFDVNKFNIRPDAAVELDKIVKIMNEYPNMVVELGSHTDCRAPKAYNASLSDKRAKASAAYIKKLISKPERIFGKGYGESKLKNGCACEGAVKSTCSDAEHQENRRTEFIIVKLLN